MGKFTPWRKSKSAKGPGDGDGDGGNNASPAMDEQLDRVVASVEQALAADEVPPPPSPPSRLRSGSTHNEPDAAFAAPASPTEMSRGRSRSIKSYVSLRSRSRSRNTAVMQLLEEKLEAEVPPGPEALAGREGSAHSGAGTRSVGSASRRGPGSPKKYVPLSHRLQEREVRVAQRRAAAGAPRAAAGTSPKRGRLRRKVRSFGFGGGATANAAAEAVEARCGCNPAMACSDAGKLAADGAEAAREAAREGLAEFAELDKLDRLDRACAPLRDRCTGKGDGEDTFATDDGTEFVLRPDDKDGAQQRARAGGSTVPAWSAWLLAADALDKIVSAGAAACLGAPPAGDRADPPPLPAAPSAATQASSPFLEDPPAAVTATEAEDVVVARVTTFPPTRGDQKALAMTLAKRHAVEEARRAKEAELEEALRVKDKAEMKATAYHEEMKWMEANLDYESKQNSALNVQVAKLKQDIITAHARLKKETLVARNEAQRAVEDRNKEIDRMEVEMVALKDKLREEAARSAEANMDPEVRKQEIRKMNEVITALRLNIDAERKMRDDAEKQAQEKTREMRLLNEAQSKALRNLEANLKAGNLQNLALEAEVADLKSEILATTAKQESLNEVNACLAEEAKTAKESAENQIKAKAKAMKEMEASLKRRIAKLEAQTSAVEKSLKAQIAQLKKETAAAKVEKRAVEAARADAVARLESDNTQLKREMTTDRRQTQKLIDTKTHELAKVSQSIEKLKKSETELESELNSQINKLKFEKVKLQKARKKERMLAQKTIDAQNEELEKVSKAIKRLKENIAQEYKLRDEAIQNESGKEVALQKKIDVMANEILAAEKKYAAKVDFVRSMSLDIMSHDSDDSDEEGDDAHEENDDFDEDHSRCSSDAGLNGANSSSSYGSTVSGRSSKRGGGWFRKLLGPNDSRTEDCDSLASSMVSDSTRKSARGKGWLRSNKWRRGRSRHGKWTPRNDSIISEDSMEDDISEDDIIEEDETMEDDKNMSYSYNSDISYSESGVSVSTSHASEAPPKKEDATEDKGVKWSKSTTSANPAGAVVHKNASSGSDPTECTLSVTDTIGNGTVEEDGDGMVGSGGATEGAKATAPSSGGVMSWFGLSEGPPKKEEAKEDKGAKRSKSNAPANSAGADVHKNASDSSDPTECTSGSDTVGDGTIEEDGGGMVKSDGATEGAKAAPSSGGVMSWFGMSSGAKEPEVSLTPVNSGESILVQ